MRLHQRSLFIRQSTFFTEKGCELLMNLAYVVEQGGCLHLLDLASWTRREDSDAASTAGVTESLLMPIEHKKLVDAVDRLAERAAPAIGQLTAGLALVSDLSGDQINRLIDRGNKVIKRLGPDDALKVTYADSFATAVRLVGLPPGIQTEDRTTELDSVDASSLGLPRRRAS